MTTRDAGAFLRHPLIHRSIRAPYAFRNFEFTLKAPGRYTLVDHALPRAVNKGAAGYLEVGGRR